MMNYVFIDKIEIEKTAALAPMASVADYSYRLMAKRFGAAYVVGEMASAKGLVYNDKNTEKLLFLKDEEMPGAVQLFGSEPYYMAKAVEIALKYNPLIIDINSGCPVPKVAGNGSGAALMKSPKLFAEIVSAAVKASSVPVTVKIRAGWDEDNINAVEIAKIAEASGASAITIHGRTKTQMYSGKADWNIIKEVKNSVKIPVIGNGDVTTAYDCVRMYEETGCDLVMIGRGSYGRPWIFKQIRDYIEKNIRPVEPDIDFKLDIMKEHIELIVKNEGEYVGMKEARKHASWYIKGVQNAAKYRNSCGQLASIDDLYRLIEKIRNENE